MVSLFSFPTMTTGIQTTITSHPDRPPSWTSAFFSFSSIHPAVMEGGEGERNETKSLLESSLINIFKCSLTQQLKADYYGSHKLILVFFSRPIFPSLLPALNSKLQTNWNAMLSCNMPLSFWVCANGLALAWILLFHPLSGKTLLIFSTSSVCSLPKCCLHWCSSFNSVFSTLCFLTSMFLSPADLPCCIEIPAYLSGVRV